MRGKMTLYVNQYGDKFYAKTVKELRQSVGGSVQKMYVDDKHGKSHHVGYVIGNQWLTAYVPFKGKA